MEYKIRKRNTTAYIYVLVGQEMAEGNHFQFLVRKNLNSRLHLFSLVLAPILFHYPMFSEHVIHLAAFRVNVIY